MSQTAEVGGHCNSIVQIVGDGNRVTLRGAARLAITRHTTGFRARTEREFDLLKPYARAIELVGRERERAELGAWLTGDRRPAVRVLTGQGGSGKTRLALDLCDDLPREDWQAGFVDGDDLATFCADAGMVEWRWDRPTLVVVDYAATYADTLKRWLGRLADHAAGDAPALHILLLERQADREAGWWRTVFGGGKSRDRAVRALLDPEAPVEIEPLAAAEHRRAIFACALARSCALLDRQAPAIVQEDFDRRLAELSWGGRPLFLMMAAMLAAKEGLPHVLVLGRTDLAMELAARELSRIGDAARTAGLDPVLAEALAGYVTLCQGMEPGPLMAAIRAEQAALGRSGDPGRIADLLHDQIPGPGRAAAPILPDIVGEAAMLQAFRHYDDGAGPMPRAFAAAGARAVASVIRTAQDYAGQTIDGRTITAPLAWLDALIEREDVDLDQLSIISNELIEILSRDGASLALTDHARRITETIIARIEPLAGEDDTVRIELARNKNNLGNMLSAVGRRDEALLAAEEAVALYRELAAARPDAFRPDLAMSLSNLGTRLRDVGRRDEALLAAEEAVALYRELAAARPDAFRPDLAGSLSNLGTRLSDVGRRDEALLAAEEAVALYRELAAARPDAFRPDLALSLSVLGDCLEGVERLAEAVVADEEAVRTIRPYFLHSPSAHAGKMRPIARDYFRRCKALAQEPDMELLGPILEILQALEDK